MKAVSDALSGSRPKNPKNEEILAQALGYPSKAAAARVHASYGHTSRSEQMAREAVSRAKANRAFKRLQSAWRQRRSRTRKGKAAVEKAGNLSLD